ncbi:MAG: hypothetical protein PVG90_14030, partial [Bacillota bacterium]
YPRNTQYGWLTKPYPARTFTLSEMPSLLGVRYRFILCAGIVRSGLAQRFYIHDDESHFNHSFHRE